MLGATELLEREAHFRKLNQELEDKTVRLMKEIEDVMNKQDNSISNFPMPRTPYSSLIKPETQKIILNQDKSKKKTNKSSDKDSPLNSETNISKPAKPSSPSKQRHDKNKLDCNDTDADCLERNHIYIEKTFNQSKCEKHSPLSNYEEISNCSTPEFRELQRNNDCVDKSIGDNQGIDREKAENESKILKNNYNTYLVSTNNMLDDKKGCRARSSTRSKDCSKRGKSVTYLDKLVRQGIIDKVFPESFKDESLYVESICQFLTSKVKMLQTELDNQNKAMKTKAIQCERHMKDVIGTTEARSKLTTQNNTLRERGKKQDELITKLTQSLKERTTECVSLRASLTAAESSARANETRANTAEARMERANSETEKTRVAKEEAIRKEEELREASRQHAETLTAALRKAEKQCRDAVRGFRRQASLIDNLRRQNALLAADKALELTEKDYLRILNWDGDAKK